MSTALHAEPALSGSQPSHVSPDGATGHKLFNCARCMTRQTTQGARRWLHIGRVCAGCDHILRGAPSKAAAPASAPKFTACPAKGLAAGYDPRTQVAPGTRLTGFFTSDWQAKRRAAA